MTKQGPRGWCLLVITLHLAHTTCYILTVSDLRLSVFVKRATGVIHACMGIVGGIVSRLSEGFLFLVVEASSTTFF